MKALCLQWYTSVPHKGNKTMKVIGSDQIVGSSFSVFAKPAVSSPQCLWVDTVDGIEKHCESYAKPLGKNQREKRRNDPKKTGYQKTHGKYCQAHAIESRHRYVLAEQLRYEARDAKVNSISVALTEAIGRASEAYAEFSENGVDFFGKAFVVVRPGNCMLANALADQVAPVSSIGGVRRIPVAMIVTRGGSELFEGACEVQERAAGNAFIQSFSPEQLVEFGTEKNTLSLTLEVSV